MSTTRKTKPKKQSKPKTDARPPRKRKPVAAVAAKKPALTQPGGDGMEFGESTLARHRAGKPRIGVGK